MSNEYTDALVDGMVSGVDLIQVWGYWIEDNKPIHATVARCHREITDDERELLLNDDNIFYIIAHDEKVAGRHDDFVITSQEVC